MKKRCLALWMAIALAVSSIPVTAEDMQVQEETQTEKQVETQPETQSETQPETTPETVPETTLETTAETQPETSPDTTPETTETQSETQSESHTQESSEEPETEEQTTEAQTAEEQAELQAGKDTDDWLEQLSFHSISSHIGGFDYPIEPEFSPEVHEYTLYFPDYLKGIYGLATSMLAPSRPVYSKFVSHKGEDTEVNLAQYAKFDNYNAMDYIVDYGPGENTMVISSYGGTEEYRVHVKRVLSLSELKATYAGTEYTLYDHDREKFGAEKVLNFQKEYDLYLPGDTTGQTLSILPVTYFYKYTENREKYQVAINGVETPTDEAYAYTLKDGDEDIEIRLSYEGCKDTVYTLHVHPVLKQLNMTFSTTAENVEDSFYVKVYDSYNAEVTTNQEDPLTFTNLLDNNEYTYTAYAVGYQPVSGSFIAKEEHGTIQIEFEKKSKGRYLDDLGVYTQSFDNGNGINKLVRHEELDNEYGGIVYVADYDSYFSSRSFYVNAMLSAFAPEGSEITMSTVCLDGTTETETILNSSKEHQLRKSFSKVFFEGGADGVKRAVCTVTAGKGDDTEVYKILVNRVLQLSDMTCTTLKNGDNVYSEKKFTRARSEYHVSLTDGVDTLYLTPQLPDKLDCQLLVDGELHASGECIEIPLGKDNTDIQVVLRSEEQTYQDPQYAGLTYQSEGNYVIHVTRARVSDVTFTVDPADATVCLYDANGSRVYSTLEKPNVFTDLVGGMEYTYTVSCYGFVSQSGTFQAEPGKEIAVKLERSDTVHAGLDNNDWWNYRNNEENNGVSQVATPTSPDETSEKWAVKLGGSWSESCTPPLILNGYLYTGAGKYIYKLDKETGEVLGASEQLKGSLVFALNPLTYAEGMIYAQIGNGQIQAIDATTLKSCWVSEPLGGQTLSPITYKDGYLYTGTWNSESKEGCYFCLSVTDEDPNSGTEIKKCVWRYSHKGGFYWAGSYATSNYVVFGSDDGSKEGDYTASSILYSVSAKTGILIDQKKDLVGDIRTSIVEANGYIYFATKGGMLYRVKMNSDGSFGAMTSYNLGGMATASPVVYKGRIYIGVCGTGGQFSQDAGHHFDVLQETANGISLAYSVPMRGYPQAGATLSTAYEDQDFNGDGKPDGRVYLYFTYNTYPGGISVLTDEPGQTSGKAEDLFTPETKKQQYCISTICVDQEGTLYYKNDSGYLMAVTSNSAYLKDVDIKASTGKIKWDDDFQSSKGRYTLTVPGGTKEVSLTLTLPEGRTATVNGADYQGSCTVPLDANGEGKIEVAVYNNQQKRTYQFILLSIGSDATLSKLVVSDSNNVNATANYLSINPSFSPEQTQYTTEIYSGDKKFLNIYASPTGKFAKVAATPREGVRRIMRFEGTAGTGGMTRFAVYFEEGYSTAEVTLTVTAGDGVTKQEYQVSLVRTDLYPPVLTQEKVWRIDEDTAQISFVSNETGYYYIQAVPSGAAVPQFDLSKPGTELAQGQNTCMLDQLQGAGRDIYILAVDSLGNQMSAPHKLTLAGHQELEVTFDVTPAQAVVQVVDDAGRQIAVENGRCKVLQGNHYKVTISCDGYDIKELEFTAAQDTLYWKVELQSNRGSDCTLKALYVSSSEKYGLGVLKLTPSFVKTETRYSATYEKEREYLNVWVEPTDSKATVKVFALSGIKGSTVSKEDESLELKEKDGHRYCQVYFEKQEFEAAVRVCVTAEDGSIQNYFVDLAIKDTTPPVIKRVTASRITEKKASVIFKASEKGKYYYSVTEKNGSKNIDTSGKGIDTIAGTNIITLDNLTAGEKEIHIIMKDNFNNFSETLTISIPESRLKSSGAHAGRPGGHSSSMYIRKRKNSVEQGSGKLKRMNRGRNVSRKKDGTAFTDEEEKILKSKNKREEATKNTEETSGKGATPGDGKNTGSDGGKGSGKTMENTIKAVQQTWDKLPTGMRIAAVLALIGVCYLIFWFRAYWYNRKKTAWRKKKTNVRMKRERRLV